jgi:hypothetical protein
MPQTLQRTVLAAQSSRIRTTFLQPGHFANNVADMDLAFVNARVGSRDAVADNPVRMTNLMIF